MGISGTGVEPCLCFAQLKAKYINRARDDITVRISLAPSFSPASMPQYSHRSSSASSSREEVGEGVGYVNPPGWSTDLKQEEELASLPICYSRCPANITLAARPERTGGNNAQLAAGRKQKGSPA